MKRVLAIVLLATIILVAAQSAFAAETSPWALSTEKRPRREDLGTIPHFTHERGVKEVGASSQWLWQGRINGYLVNMRLFAPDGTGCLFQEQLRIKTPGTSDLILYLRQRTADGGLMLQVDEKALDILSDYGVREIVVADKDYYLQSSYTIAELRTLRAALGLESGEQICVGGDDDPVMIVSETGRRRYAVQ